jgi:hypothetical protein
VSLLQKLKLLVAWQAQHRAHSGSTQRVNNQTAGALETITRTKTAVGFGATRFYKLEPNANSETTQLARVIN